MEMNQFKIIVEKFDLEENKSVNEWTLHELRPMAFFAIPEWIEVLNTQNFEEVVEYLKIKSM